MAATAVPLPIVPQQFFDASGRPLAGGLVYTYVPSTTTPKTTWQDPDQTTANTNPINLDASGSAVIFGSGIYRLQVFDRLGNLISDQESEAADPNYVNGLAPVFVGDTGAGGIQGLVPAPPGGSGALNEYLAADGTFKSLLVVVPPIPDPKQAGFLFVPSRTVLATTAALVITDAGGSIIYNNAGAGTLTIPSDGSVPWPLTAVTPIMIYSLASAGVLTIQGAAGVSLLWPGSSATPAARALAANGYAVLYRVAANAWIIVGAGLS